MEFSFSEFIYAHVGLLIVFYFCIEFIFLFYVENKVYVKPYSLRMLLDQSDNLAHLKKKFHIIEHYKFNLFSVLNLLVEYFILNRYSFFGYKNRVRNNLRIYGCFLLTTFLLLMITALGKYIFNLDQNRYTMLLSTHFMNGVGFFIGSFLLERKNLYDKWIYLSNLQNKIFEIEAKPEPKPNTKFLRITFALNILDMEMWSHISFYHFFSDVMCELDMSGPTYKKLIRESLVCELRK